jgi:hypothetical protein
MKHIKNINEYFDIGVFGDTYGYGGANGVLRVKYKPYDDLSVTVGPDPSIEKTTKGAEYKLGDVVKGQPIDSKKKVTGVIVRAFKNPDNQQFRYFIQIYTKGERTKAVIEIKSNDIEFADGGNHGNVDMSSKEKGADIPAGVFNSKTVYTSSQLGLEATA